MNQELIGRYVAGRLGEQEAEAFETYCVENPDFARQVEFEQRLKAGITQVAKGNTAEFVRSNYPVRWKLAAAASAVLALSAVFYAWYHSAVLPGHAIMAAVGSEAQHNGAMLRLAQVRGAETTPKLAPGIVRVEIVGLFDAGSHYTVELECLKKKQNVKTMATLYGQHPTSPMTIEVLIDSAQLRSGTYALQVRKQGSDEDPIDFTFLKD